MLDRLTIERMRAWAGENPVLVALSGGGDSVALLHLLVEELGAANVRTLTIDHAMRDGSALDARRACDFAGEIGVEGRAIFPLKWPLGVKPSQEAARLARYRALCAHARDVGAPVIAVGHTADDQAETLLMRAANGSTWRGLAGISPFAFAPVWPEGRGVAVARPLLGVRREALRNYLTARNARWIEDPANTNAAYERVRVRQRLAELESGGFDPLRLVALAARLRQRADQLDRAALNLIERSAAFDRDIRISFAAWSGPSEVRFRALAVLIAAAAGASRELPLADVEEIEPRIMSREHRGSTHSGVVFEPAKDGVVLRREPAAILGRTGGAAALPPLDLVAGVEAIWDGRYSVTSQVSGLRLVPAHDGAFTVLGNHKPSDLHIRPLLDARVRHAFAPDINSAKP